MKHLFSVFLALIAALCLFNPIELFADAGMTEAAGQYVCKIAKERSKKNLAVFPLANEKDEEDAASRKATTRIIIVLNNCGLKVLDKSKLKKVLSEQSMGQSGLVDADNAPEVGRLLGADTLIFGTVDKTSVQVRLVDATTGEILGAVIKDKPVAGSGGKKKVQVVALDKKEAKKQFSNGQLKRWLQRTFRNKPGLFLYVTANEKQMVKFRRRFGPQIERLERKISSWKPAKQKKLKDAQAKVRVLRGEKPRWNRRIKKLQKKALRRLRRRR